MAIKRILVATDFDESSKHALQLALELQTKFQAELTLVHVWELPSFGYMEVVPIPEEVLNQISKAAEVRMAALVASIEGQCPNTKSLVKMGNVHSEVLRVVAETGADLLVLGTHGRRGLQRALLGSVAEKLVRTSPIPVLTVHGGQDRHQ